MLPPIYYINLDHRMDRKDHMDTINKKYKLNAIRISSVYGKDVSNHLYGNIPKNLRLNEIACSISHLRAIKYWLENSDSDTAIICEDDISWDTYNKWSFEWNEFTEKLPYYWDIVQLSIIYHPRQLIIVNLHPRTTYDYSTACYLIKRSYAKKLLSLYEHNGLWKLDYPVSLPLTAEEVLYRPGSCLSIPLFTTKQEFESDIQTKEHVDMFHIFSRNIINTLWSSKEMNIAILDTYPLLMLQNS